SSTSCATPWRRCDLPALACRLARARLRFSRFATARMAATRGARSLFPDQSVQFFLLSVDGAARHTLARRHHRSLLFIVARAQRRARVARVTRGDNEETPRLNGRSRVVLAFHGRAVGLSVCTPTLLEVSAV